MTKLNFLPLLLLSAAVVSCSSGSSSSSGGGTSSGNPFGGGALDGTWDVVTTDSNGNESTGSITIGPNVFALSVKGFEVNATLGAAAPDVSYNYRSKTKKLDTQLEQSAFPQGDVGFPLGGKWTINGTSTERCIADIKVPAASLSCQSLPSPVRNPLEGLATAQRTATAASNFGDFGGTWNVSLAGKNGTCDVTFDGNVFSANCSESKGLIKMTFEGATASGSWENVAEISAKKR